MREEKRREEERCEKIEEKRGDERCERGEERRGGEERFEFNERQEGCLYKETRNVRTKWQIKELKQ